MNDTIPILRCSTAESEALLLANLNCIVLDFAARTSVGGASLNYFVMKQLPILPPSEFVKDAYPGTSYADLIIPRVLELTYTSNSLKDFAVELGYSGPPFPWNEEVRHKMKCELDAIFAKLYELDRADLEWILDAPPPSLSFPGLKQKEIKEFGEYRTKRLVLEAFDSINRGDFWGQYRDS